MTGLTKLFSRLLLPSEMVPKKLIQGELPDARTAYQTTLRLAMPALIELVLVALIGTFDTMMVGKLGPAAISSVGIATQPRMLLMALFFALNVGVTAITARKKGEGNQEQANLCLRQSIIITAVLSVILTVAAYIWARELLILAAEFAVGALLALVSPHPLFRLLGVLWALSPFVAWRVSRVEKDERRGEPDRGSRGAQRTCCTCGAANGQRAPPPRRPRHRGSRR